MDGLRLALIIAGIVVVAAVYWWTARRRRMEREIGEFDRFDAWTDDSLDPLTDPDRLDPLADADSITEPNPKLGDPIGSSGTDPDDPSSASLGDSKVLEGLEAIAESLDTRREPSLGDVDGVQAAPLERPVAAAPSRPAREKKPPKSAPPPAAPASPREAPPAVPELVIVINVMAPVGATFDGPPLREALENAGLQAGDMKLYHFRTEAQRPGAPPIFSALNMVKPGTLAPEQFEGLRTPGIALVMRLPGPERPIEAFELMHGTATAIAGELGGRLCDESRSALTRQTLNLMRERIAELVRRQRAGG